ncbi:MAG: ubiquinone biosynthesis regulatory protein kinase UbiB, partial [Sulfurimicrobium sp.]|nr:ubiquinone biosynthesis regulatory protein kinase UbiB [Sulfurimicrobium sp.]
LVNALKTEAPNWAGILPQLPRLAHAYLRSDSGSDLLCLRAEMAARERREQRRFWLLAVLLALVLLSQTLPWAMLLLE